MHNPHCIQLDGVDYWPVHDAVTRFVPVVAQLSACRVASDEIDKFAHDLRAEYIANRPRLIDKGSASFVLRTDFRELVTGRTICVRVQFDRLSSIRIAGATTKMTVFEICDPTGVPFGSLRSLPFVVDNIRGLNYTLRTILGERFSPEVFSTKLFAAYVAAGEPHRLPIQLRLCETQDGRSVDLRLEAEESANPLHARAVLVVDGLSIEDDESLPAIMRFISWDALDKDSFCSLADMVGLDEKDCDDLRYRLFCRVDYIAQHQRDRMVECDLAGESVLLFPTGEKSAEGHRIFCFARDCVDGKYNTVCWVRERDLVCCGLPADRLPAEIDFEQDVAETLDGSLPLSSPDIVHVLHNLDRWAAPEMREDEGRMMDEFDRWYVRSFRSALDTKSFVYGFYSAKSNGTKDAVVHPIQALAPLIDDAGTVRGAFVVRRVNRNGSERLEVPTVLTCSQAKKSVSVLAGEDLPEWLSGKGGCD